MKLQGNLGASGSRKIFPRRPFPKPCGCGPGGNLGDSFRPGRKLFPRRGQWMSPQARLREMMERLMNQPYCNPRVRRPVNPNPNPGIQPVYGAPIGPPPAVQPVYGAPIGPPPVMQPVYGAPISPPPVMQPVYGAPSFPNPPIMQMVYGSPSIA